MMSIWEAGRTAISVKAALAATAIIGCLAATEALAQSTACGDVQKFLVERKSISDKIAAQSKGKQIDAKFACNGFGQLVSNGTGLLKWIDANKEWCQIPETFAEGMKADHGRAIQIRAKACGIAAKQAQMEKQAREGGGNQGGGGLLGGAGLAGQSQMPKGAL